MSRRRKDGSSDDPHSIETMRSAALHCLDCCSALEAWARGGEHAWARACREGIAQTYIAGLAQAIERGKWIEREPRLTLGPPRTFGNITARNAHMAALILGRRMSGHMRRVIANHGTSATEAARASAEAPFGWSKDAKTGRATRVRCDYTAWRERIQSEADRAARLPPPTSVSRPASKARRKIDGERERIKLAVVRPVELRGRSEPPTVRGKLKEGPLTKAQYDVVAALLAAGEQGLSKDALVKQSGHEDARGVLRRLSRNDPDWRAVIKFPGKPGVHYRIV